MKMALSEMKNFAQILQNTARRLPEKTALVCNGLRYSYARLEEESNRIASALKKRGVKLGDKVALLTPNSIDFVVVVFGCAKLGAIPVKLNWRLAPEELNYLLDFNDCSVLFYRYNNAKWHAELNEMLSHKQMLFVSLDRTERSKLCYEELLGEGEADYEIAFYPSSANARRLVDHPRLQGLSAE